MMSCTCRRPDHETRTRLRTFVIVATALFIAAAAGAAEDGAPLTMRGARVIGGPVTPMIVNVDTRDLPAVEAWQPGDPIKESPRRFYPPKGVDPTSYEALLRIDVARVDTLPLGVDTPADLERARALLATA